MVRRETSQNGPLELLHERCIILYFSDSGVNAVNRSLKRLACRTSSFTLPVASFLSGDGRLPRLVGKVGRGASVA